MDDIKLSVIPKTGFVIVGIIIAVIFTIVGGYYMFFKPITTFIIEIIKAII